MDLICPNSTPVWDGNRFSKCFDDMVLGFAPNAVTVLMICILGITQWNGRRNQRINFMEKVFMHVLPILGACLSSVDIILFLKKKLHGEFISYHDWLFRCSQFAVWVLRSLKESCILLLDIMFGISINIIRIKQTPLKNSSTEEPLLSSDVDIEEACPRDSGHTWSYWDHMTFMSIISVMNRGVTKQLDFEDLLSLPTDMDPSTCHYKLLTCWQAQQSSIRTDPSLFRAICCAYGGQYLCLGFLKAFNDCIGFAGPLLLNKLIKFLQQGLQHLSST
ncbi:hypothetical protein JRO89_XS09G0001300 [Xanthoceras sorbifolium]|uniref:Uncharacterized protein n=1 Tax=Xanthoceras sorbifolium TaxID=99658 RepID=A0ABQ8HK30_9ROSI|nr:hypothetical protein JRO89_XS09G0001300 [Xanthoceras sorbifolium]